MARCRNEDGDNGAGEQLLMGWNFLFSRDTQGPIIEIGINVSEQPHKTAFAALLSDQ